MRLQKVLDGYMDKMETTTVSKMATWKRWRLPQWLIWLNKQDGDYNSLLDSFMNKMESTSVSKTRSRLKLTVANMAKWMQTTHRGLYGYMDKLETTTVAKIAIWTRCRLPQWLRWLHGQDADYHSV